MKFIEETESAWSAEQLAAAEREIEEQKREWEQNRLAAMREEEERRARELEDNDIITFSREDATNQVSSTKNKKFSNHAKRILHKKRGLKNKHGNVVGKKKVLHKFNNEKTIAKAKLSRHQLHRRKIRRQNIAKKDEIKADKEKVYNDIESNDDSSHLSKSVDNDDSLDLKINGTDTNSGNSPTNSSSLEEEESDSDSRGYFPRRISNHVDHNSPRTRSRGTVAINLWTLDVSPILPGVKPIKNSRNRDKSDDETSQASIEKDKSKSKRKVQEHDKNELSNDDEDDESLEDTKNRITATKLTENVKKLTNNSGKICKVVLSDILGRSANVPKPDKEKCNIDIQPNTTKKTDLEDVESSVDKSDSSLSTNKNLSKDSLDNGLDRLKSLIRKKMSSTARSKRFSKVTNNKTLDSWITRSPPVGKSADKSSESSLNNSLLKRTCSEADLKNDEITDQCKSIKSDE